MKENRLPFQVWILTLAAFAIGTAEFIIAGVLKDVATAFSITEGAAGNFIGYYALAIVIGGPILTLWLSRYDKKMVLIGLIGLFIVGNLICAFAPTYHMMLLGRVISGLTQGPFYGIGAVIATELVTKEQSGRAIGQMFAGLTLANVLGVPGGTFIAQNSSWDTTFIVVAFLGLVTMISIIIFIKDLKENQKENSIISQLSVFKNPKLIGSLLSTVLVWTGFMSVYGYLAPLSVDVAGISEHLLTPLLILVGFGLLVGNNFGGKAADKNLDRSLIVGAVFMIVSMIILGFVDTNYYLFWIFAFVFGIGTFFNVPSMQMNVMRYGAKAPELAGTANISAFNIANFLGASIGGYILDSQSIGASAIPFYGAIIPIIGLVFIFITIKSNNKKSVQFS
ncbi:MAG: MFS transporter [Psychrilyobacter sp.]|uniref:MFS transporter n=1 Tax=Psychrilyobacter sp. TaxID=2586924 RepID=UPI003C71A066